MPPSSSYRATAEEAPLAVKDDLLRLAAKLTDALMLMDKEFRILYANPMALQISQLTEADLRGRTLWEHYPGILESPLGQAYLEAVATREERVIEGFYYEPLKTIFDLHIFPMESGVGVHYRDVTAQRVSEQKERTLEDRVRVTLQAANGIGVWDWDIVEDRVRADVRFCTLYGVDPALADVGAPLAAFTRNIHPEDAPRIAILIERAMQNGEFDAQYRILQADGSVRWVATRGTVVFNAEGEPVRFPGVALDVTAEREREEALRLSEARYRVLTELSPQSLWTASAEGLVLYANQRFLTYIGHEFVPKTGLEYLACFDPEDRERVVEVWTRSVTTGEDYAIDARLIRAADGASRWWHLRALPVRDAGGNIEQWLGSAVDMHDERLVQQKLLDQMEQQRRAEAALIQSEKLAAVGRMASSIAHEINNPLESVTNLIYLARAYAIDPDAQKYLDMADQELRRVSSIANQTLRFHKQASNPRAITSAELLSTVLSLYEGRLRNSNIQVDSSRLDGSPVDCFEGDIRQVLNNLVGNAVDAMPSGGRLILRGRDATDVSSTGKGRSGLRLTIADTGSGMSAETQARVFDAFFTTKGIAGTGLGLWISSEIMQRHDGHLRMRSSQSTAHHGTVFTLFLPCESALRTNASSST